MERDTGGDTRSRHVDAMGSDLGPVYSAIWNECASLYWGWAQYRELYCSGPERERLLIRSAGRFFRVAESALRYETLLHLVRLTDPPKLSAGRPNLNFQRLPDLLGDPDLQREVQGLVERAVAATGFARDWRNGRIAHTDLELALGESDRPLAAHSETEITEAVTAICGIMEKVARVYMNSDLLYELMDTRSEAAETLLYLLRDGLEGRERRLEQIKRGETDPNELRPRPV